MHAPMQGRRRGRRVGYHTVDQYSDKNNTERGGGASEGACVSVFPRSHLTPGPPLLPSVEAPESGWARTRLQPLRSGRRPLRGPARSTCIELFYTGQTHFALHLLARYNTCRCFSFLCEHLCHVTTAANSPVQFQASCCIPPPTECYSAKRT